MTPTEKLAELRAIGDVDDISLIDFHALIDVAEAAAKLSESVNSLRFHDYGCRANVAEAESIASTQDKLDAALSRLGGER